MSHCIRRVPLAPEVNTFQAKVSRDQRLFARRQPQHGAIVPNAQTTPQPRSFLPNSLDQLFFLQRHVKDSFKFRGPSFKSGSEERTSATLTYVRKRICKLLNIKPLQLETRNLKLENQAYATPKLYYLI